MAKSKEVLLAEYQFRILSDPRSSITLNDKPRKKSEKAILKIKGYTFDNIPFKFKIRPKAANFMIQKQPTDSPVFVVLYFDEDRAECLFAFRFLVAENHPFEIIRCLGSNISKKHWLCVEKYITEYKSELMDLKVEDVLRHYSFEIC